MHNDDNHKNSLKYSYYRYFTSIALLQVMNVILRLGIITPCLFLAGNYINQ